MMVSMITTAGIYPACAAPDTRWAAAFDLLGQVRSPPSIGNTEARSGVVHWPRPHNREETQQESSPSDSTRLTPSLLVP